MENNSGRNAEPPRRTASTGRRHSSTREMLLRMIEAQSAAVSTGALVAASGLHENTVRGHLEHLLADGYVTRDAALAEGRGRPAWLWRAHIGSSAAPYAALAGVLAETLSRTSADPVAEAREAGRRWGQDLAPSQAADSSDPRGTVVNAMREAGFDPHDTGSEVLLRRCPLIEAAVKYSSVVCSVHLGMIDGVLEAAGGQGEADLEPFTSPSECTLRLRVVPTSSSL